MQRLIEAMQQARLTKGHYQCLADRLTAWFLPMANESLWPHLFGMRETGFEAGLLSGLTVLLIACPCALGLATPMSVWISLGRAAQHQVLFRHGDAIERLAACARCSSTRREHCRAASAK